MTSPSPRPRKKTSAKPRTETPQEHVEAHPNRLTEAEDKAEVLAKATENLSGRVATLSGVVQTNNKKIDFLASELNKKPDDAEVQFITGQAQAERKRHFAFAVSTAVASAVLAGLISYWFAQQQLHERTEAANASCKVSNSRTGVLIERFEQFARDDENPAQIKNLEDTAMKLRESIVNCDALHPVKD